MIHRDDMPMGLTRVQTIVLKFPNTNYEFLNSNLSRNFNWELILASKCLEALNSVSHTPVTAEFTSHYKSTP